MADSHKNFALSLVATAPSPAVSGSSLIVTAGEGALFPTPPFNATVCPVGANPTVANAEIVRVTAISTDTLTITRAQEDTSARTILVGDQIFASITVKTLTDVENMGTTSLVRNETPGGLIDNSNTAYTTASTFATGSLKVYLNGQRLTPGGADFTEGIQGFTMAYAPLTGDILLVDYETTNDAYVVGSNSTIVAEAPTGLVDSSNTTFTTLQGKYVANTLEVFINGLLQTKTTDYAETTPGSGVFTFTVAPTTGDAVRVSYQVSTGASANADTVDGYHGDDLMPVGSLLMYASNTLPSSNWLMCYGQAVSRTTYATLFSRLSTVYGVGDGSTTFNLPDLRGRVAAGQDDMGGTSANRLTNPGSTGGMDGDVLGGTGGQEAHVQTTGELATHGHTQNSHWHNVGLTSADDGTMDVPAVQQSGSAAFAGWRFDVSDTTTSLRKFIADGTVATNQNTGSSTAFNVVQPTIILNYIIKAL